jgi:hypothetical protein
MLRSRWTHTLLVAATGLALASCGASDGPRTKGGPIVTNRLTEGQYRQSIADIFGADIRVLGSFEPEVRASGLLAIGSAAGTITPSGFEQYEGRARAIAEQVVDEKHRPTTVACQPSSPDKADPVCATQFTGKFGRLLFRHPLTPSELQNWVGAAGDAATASHSFYTGLKFALAGMLTSPKFLFRQETMESVSDSQTRRLDAFSIATRLSFFLWNTTPDDELLTAAANGELHSKRGLARQVDRMLASPRLEAGVRAFFSDFLEFDAFDTFVKDPIIYPKFTQRVADDAKEQTLRTITDLLIERHGDYRDLFTTRHTFMTRTLGMVYDVPVTSAKGWEPFEFSRDDPREGLLSQVSFVALHAHPGRSSPTLRGKAVRELLLCQHVPAPPANVNFTVVQDTSNPQYKTARARVTAHRTNAICAGCHKIMDPIGLALENFDGLGQLRTQENGVDIDASGELDGVAFKDAAGLGTALHDNPALSTCLVDSVYRYAAGRAANRDETEWVRWLNERFAANGYRLPELLRAVATSEALFSISPDVGPKP